MTRLPPCVILCSSWQQDLSPRCSLLGANRFCQPSSQRSCHSAQPAVRLEGVGRAQQVLGGKMEVWLEGTEQTEEVEVGGLARGTDGWTPERQPALEVTPPAPTAHRQPEAQIIHRRACRDPLWPRSIPVFLIQLAWTSEACRQPESYFWIYFPSPVEWNSVEMEPGRCSSSSSATLLQTTAR